MVVPAKLQPGYSQYLEVVFQRHVAVVRQSTLVLAGCRLRLSVPDRKAKVEKWRGL